MPSFDLAKKTLRYATSDEAAVYKAITLLSAMSEYADNTVAPDAEIARVKLLAIQKHIHDKRAGKSPATKPAEKKAE